MPKDNERDFDELPQLIKDEMKLHFVSEMDDVLRIALEGHLPKLEEDIPAALAVTMPPPKPMHVPGSEARQ